MTVFDDAVLTLRSEWAKTMTDACTIARTTDRGTFNATTGAYDAPTSAQQYSGVCRFRTAKAGSELDFGEQLITEIEMIVELPYTATGIEPDDIVTVTTAADPELVGQTMRVLAVAADSRPTHRHVALARNLGAGSP